MSAVVDAPLVLVKDKNADGRVYLFMAGGYRALTLEQTDTLIARLQSSASRVRRRAHNDGDPA